MSKIGGAVIGGIMLFTLAHYGLDGIMNAMDKVSDTRDKIEKTQDFYQITLIQQMDKQVQIS